MYIHAYTHAYIHIYIYAHMHTYLHIYIHNAHIHACIHACITTCTHLHGCMVYKQSILICVHTLVNIHAYMHTHLYIQIYRNLKNKKIKITLSTSMQNTRKTSATDRWA